MDKKSDNRDILALAITLIIGVISVVLATLHIVGYIVAGILFGADVLSTFLVAFERSHQRAKMIVLMASLSALAIVGRWAFAWLPNVTLSTGIIILAGASLGALPGFVVGALTMFVSNMLLGQGLWTVWQMLMAGAIGMVAGYLHRADRLVLAIYAFFACFVYGFVMDIFTLVTVYDTITAETFLLVWGASFYFDLVHAISSLLTVIFFYNVVKRPVSRHIVW